MEGILNFHGYDANNHPSIDDDEEEQNDAQEPPKKKRKKNVVENLEEDEDEDDLDKNNGPYSDPGDQEIEELCEYEQLRASNIKEREQVIKNLGLVPHSQVMREWENQ